VQAKVATVQAHQARLGSWTAAIEVAQENVDTLIPGRRGVGHRSTAAFGRDGIQALEIDAAGPELSTLTNDLLTSCFGERFEIRFVTRSPRPTARG